MKTRSLANTSLTLCSLVMLLTMPWAASAHGSSAYRSAAAAGTIKGPAGELPKGAESRTTQCQPAQAPPTWQIRTVEGDGVGYFTSLALDATGYPHISYYDYENKNLKYARWTGQTWVSETVHAGEDMGSYTSLALDADGRPHISYFDLDHSALWYASWTGSGWNRQMLDDTGFTGWDTSLALDANDYPQIAYLGRGEVVNIRWTGSEWRIRRVDGTVQETGVGTSLALDANGYPHVSYCDVAARKLKYAHWTGSEWLRLTVDEGSQMLWSSLKLDSLGHAHISYCDYSNRDLKYARWTGSTWEVRLLDRAGDVGYYTSLALDAGDRPHISYYDETNNRLKYAHWTGSTWRFEAVASDGGTDTSLALDGSGHPHISYNDQAHQALDHATPYLPLDLSSSALTAHPPRTQSGAIVTYTIRLVNRGDLYQSTSFTLTNPIPPHTTYVTGSARASEGTIDGGVRITWNGTIAGMQSLTASYAVKVDPALTGPTAILNTAALAGDPAGLLTLSATVLVNPLVTFLPLVARDG